MKKYLIVQIQAMIEEKEESNKNKASKVPLAYSLLYSRFILLSYLSTFYLYFLFIYFIKVKYNNTTIPKIIL